MDSTCFHFLFKCVHNYLANIALPEYIRANEDCHLTIEKVHILSIKIIYDVSRYCKITEPPQNLIKEEKLL